MKIEKLNDAQPKLIEVNNKVFDENGNQVAYYDEDNNVFVVSSQDADWWED